MKDEVAELKERVQKLESWVSDLQSGMYINCVYCGHRYGPDSEVPATMADALKEHVEQCSEHPMSALRKDFGAMKSVAEKWKDKSSEWSRENADLRNSWRDLKDFISAEKDRAEGKGALDAVYALDYVQSAMRELEKHGKLP